MQYMYTMQHAQYGMCISSSTQSGMKWTHSIHRLTSTCSSPDFSSDFTSLFLVFFLHMKWYYLHIKLLGASSWLTSFQSFRLWFRTYFAFWYCRQLMWVSISSLSRQFKNSGYGYVPFESPSFFTFFFDSLCHLLKVYLAGNEIFLFSNCWPPINGLVSYSDITY